MLHRPLLPRGRRLRRSDRGRRRHGQGSKGLLDMSQVRGGLREWFGVNYMKVGRKIWWRLPDWSRQFPPVRWYGMHLHAIVQQKASRDQNHSTLFFRNGPSYGC